MGPDCDRVAYRICLRMLSQAPTSLDKLLTSHKLPNLSGHLDLSDAAGYLP